MNVGHQGALRKWTALRSWRKGGGEEKAGRRPGSIPLDKAAVCIDEGALTVDVRDLPMPVSRRKANAPPASIDGRK